MVAHRMPGISKLLQAAAPRQEPHYRRDIPSIVYYLHHIESEKTITMPEALAQICWMKKENNGKLPGDDED